jgi:glycosyltransferase involved in cell wall biosynthesis
VRQFLVPYARRFRELGWRVDAAANGASIDPELAESFDHLYELPLSRSLFDLAGEVRAGRALDAVLRGSSPDIVHVHTPIAAFVTRLAVRRLPPSIRPSVVYTAHGFHFYRGGAAATNAAFLTAERVAGRWTDRLIVINDEDEDAARRHRIVPGRRLVRMPGIGVDTGFYSRGILAPGAIEATRADLGLAASTPYFVTVAELSRRKRNADVIRALARMRHADAALVLAGNGTERGRLEDLATRLGVRRRLTFAGLVLDIRPLVSGAVALVLASDREGLARAVMEAAALEVPVVASTARGNQELVSPATGFIYRTGDVASLADRMDWLVDHPDQAWQMGRRARERMVGSYDLARLLRLHEDLYTGLLREREPRRTALMSPGA